MNSTIAARYQNPFFSSVIPQNRSRISQSRHSHLESKGVASPTAEEVENKRFLDDMKQCVHTRKLEELDQVSCQQKLDLQFNRETWEKFHLLKSQVDDKKGQVYAFVETIKDLKFVIYLGGGAQMIQLDQRTSIYVGGLGINYKNAVVTFKEQSRGEVEPAVLRV